MKQKKKMWIKKANSLSKAKQFNNKYYASRSPEECLSDIQICREQYFLMKGIDESRKRLRRVLKIIKQK